MLFNVEKCKFGCNNLNALYSMGNVTLSEVNEEKEVGVTFTKDLKAVSNCGEVVKRQIGS